LKNSPDSWIKAFQGPERPDFAEKSCSDLGIEAGPNSASAADLPFLTGWQIFETEGRPTPRAVCAKAR
jgi:hypothetical protein